jgi:hypothetical protein
MAGICTYHVKISPSEFPNGKPAAEIGLVAINEAGESRKGTFRIMTENLAQLVELIQQYMKQCQEESEKAVEFWK